MTTSWLLLLLLLEWPTTRVLDCSDELRFGLNCIVRENTQGRGGGSIDRRPNLVSLDGELLDVLELEVDEGHADGLGQPGEEGVKNMRTTATVMSDTRQRSQNSVGQLRRPAVTQRRQSIKKN